MTSRSSLLSVLAFAATVSVVWGLGCASEKGAARDPGKGQPGSAAPGGDVLRLRAILGDATHARVKIVLELEPTAGHTVAHSFSCTEEERVDAVEPDGSAQVTARLLDVAGSSAEPKTTDAFSLALDELKVQFKRSPRGDVGALAVAGVRAPLDDRIARSIVNALYAGARGPVFPEPKIEPGMTWKVQTPQTMTPFGIVGDGTYSYTYARREGEVAVVTGIGTLEGKSEIGGQSRRLTGQGTSEWQLALDGGRLRFTKIDQTTEVAETPATPRSAIAGRQRVLVEWSLNQEGQKP